MSSDRRRVILFFNKCRFMIWHILISESLSVYGRHVVGLLSAWVRDCPSAVGYESSIVAMIGFQPVSCRLSIGLKSGDSIPNLTRLEPDWFYDAFSNIVGGRQLADSLKILCFCRFRVGLAGVTGVLLTTKICIRHNIDAAAVCVKIYSYTVARNGIAMKRNV